MPQYEKYTTTVVGAHSVPRWYEALDRLITAGQLSASDFADAQLRASQAAVLEQEIAGIDVITGGEMHRRTHNRHSPPNAMLNYFWQKIPAFQGVTRPKPISKHDPNVFHPAATCRGPINESIDLGLVSEFSTVSSFARKTVKITMTGPHLLAAVAYDDYYNDITRMMNDLGKLLHWNFKRLAEAGCKHIRSTSPILLLQLTRRCGTPSTQSTLQLRVFQKTSMCRRTSAKATTLSVLTTTAKLGIAISTPAGIRPILCVISSATPI
jgi:5-methyltetrahydropteroyltriglutamate--homocysteine methyltransferase